MDSVDSVDWLILLTWWTWMDQVDPLVPVNLLDLVEPDVLDRLSNPGGPMLMCALPWAVHLKYQDAFLSCFSVFIVNLHLQFQLEHKVILYKSCGAIFGLVVYRTILASIYFKLNATQNWYKKYKKFMNYKLLMINQPKISNHVNFIKKPASWLY